MLKRQLPKHVDYFCPGRSHLTCKPEITIEPNGINRCAIRRVRFVWNLGVSLTCCRHLWFLVSSVAANDFIYHGDVTTAFRRANVSKSAPLGLLFLFCPTSRFGTDWLTDGVFVFSVIRFTGCNVTIINLTYIWNILAWCRCNDTRPVAAASVSWHSSSRVVLYYC